MLLLMHDEPQIDLVIFSQAVKSAQKIFIKKKKNHISNRPTKLVSCSLTWVIKDLIGPLPN